MARILVVDDEPLIAMLIGEWVADLGHTAVGPAHSLKAALDLVATSEIDGVIVDVTLGRESAYPLAEVLAARGIPFAFATGLSEAAIERGHAAVAVLVKPFGLKPFEAAVQTIVSNCAQHAAPASTKAQGVTSLPVLAANPVR